MTPVGETLRRERIKRNLELDTISSELKISSRFLQAIESDQFDKLPGGVFAKSFVRQYAHLLGLDEEELSGQVERMLAPAVPQGGDRARPIGVEPIQVPKVKEWERVGDKRFHWSWLLSVAGLVAVMLVCSAIYSWMQRPKTSPVVAQAPAQTTPATSAAQTAVQSPLPAANEVKPADSVPAATTAPESKPMEPRVADAKPVAPVVKAIEKVLVPNQTTAVHVEITAEEAVWVLARADGKYAFSATLDAHTTRTVDGVTDVVLRLGNAGGVTISLNGKPIGPAGPKGQVRTVQFTSGGFQIVVPAKPPSGPVDPARPL